MYNRSNNYSSEQIPITIQNSSFLAWISHNFDLRFCITEFDKTDCKMNCNVNRTAGNSVVPNGVWQGGEYGGGYGSAPYCHGMHPNGGIGEELGDGHDSEIQEEEENPEFIYQMDTTEIRNR
ncbi:MAG: hypothetical protein ACREBR_01350 [bacterium]